MKVTKYQKSEIYYNDLYDRITVDECRRLERRFLKMDLPKYMGKDFPKANRGNMRKIMTDYALYFVTGGKYAKKEETIKKWRERDKRRDEKLESAEPIEDVRCVQCTSEMECRIKELDIVNEKERTLFFYECPGCKKRRSFYDDGTEWERKSYCPKCKKQLEVKSKRKGNVITYTENCLNCSYEDINEFDLDEKKGKKIDKNFAKDRERFCLSEEKGREYVNSKIEMAQIGEFMEKHKSACKKKEEEVKCMTIAQLEETLTKALKTNGYDKLKLGNPEINKDVIVGFTSQDKKTNRREYDSKHGLRRLIQKTLTGTNWKLMSDGVDYRLGFLSGRLRGSEKESF